MANFGQNTLYLDWGGDLQINQNGGLVLATGWDQVRQRILRRLLTNQSFTLADGSPVPADYIYDPAYGIGCRRLVGEPGGEATQSRLRQMINAAVLVDEGVDINRLPQITITTFDSFTLYVEIVVYLLTGQPGVLQLTVT